MNMLCMLCGKPSNEHQRDPVTGGGSDFFDCPNCGRYLHIDFFAQLVEKNKIVISSFLFETNRHDNHSTAYITLDEQTINQILRDEKIPKTAMQKIEKLLLYFYKKTEHIGQEHYVSSETPLSIAYAKNYNELSNMYQTMDELGWLRDFKPLYADNELSEGVIVLSIAGLTRAEELLSSSRDTGNVTPTICYDAFISHASEDKAGYVDSLVEKLREGGYSCFYDKDAILWGDSLVEQINSGLAKSKVVIVVLSDHFMKKEWPTSELEAVLAMVVSQKTRILPILHNISYDDMCAKYPLLATRLCKDSSRHSLDDIAAEFGKVMERMG